MKTQFFFQSPVSLKERTRLKSFLSNLIKKENSHIDTLNIIFCSDRYLLEINKNYLQHDYYTDIITFELPHDSQKTVELYISIDRIKQNSIDFQSTIKNELHRVIFHGILHICGFSDKKTKDKVIMTQKENEYLKKYFK